MKLIYNRKSKDPIYYMGMSYRIGKKTSTKSVMKIGKHSELLAQGYPDPLSYARQFIDEANRKEKENKNREQEMTVKIGFNEPVKSSDEYVPESFTCNVGYLFLRCIYHDLNINEFFDDITKDMKITYSPNDVNRMISVVRILNPGSKLYTWKRKSKYYGAPEFGYQHIMRTMTLMAKHFDKYIAHLYRNATKIVRYDTTVCYYDCTNFYFETEAPDLDYVDEVTGEEIKGFRKYGMSKQHQPSPLVQMGLFMDSHGLPISMCLTEGNTSEQSTVEDTEKKMIRNFTSKEIIYCADAGLGSYDIREFNNKGKRKFIVTQSIKKLSAALKEAVFNDCDYRRLSDDSDMSLEKMKTFDKTDPDNRRLYDDKIYKVLEVSTPHDCGLTETKTFKNGKTKEVKSPSVIKQRIIITFSRKSMEYQRWVRNRQIERAKKLLAKLDPETYKKGPNDVTRFIKKKKKEGENETTYCLDEERIREEEKYDGFYAVATNLNDDVRDVLAVSGRRWKIEECFRIMKTNLSSRPVFVSTKEHIIAHFMMCYTSLLIYRILERKLLDFGKKMNPPEHYTVSQIIETLQLLTVSCNKEIYYSANYSNSRILRALMQIYPLELDRQYYRPKDLNKIVKKYR